jgi:hypothetical protein
MDASSIAVTIEYPRVRQERRLHDLADEVGADMVPLLDEPAFFGLDATSYAKALVEQLTDERRSVRLVVAVCLAAPIGHEVARLLTELRGVAPVLVVLDGTPVDVADFVTAYHIAIEGYGGRPSQARVTVTGTDLTNSPKRILSEIRAELIDLATEQLLGGSRHGDLVSPVVDRVVNVSMAWLCQVIAAHNTEFHAWEGDVVLGTSDEATFHAEWPGARRTREVAVGGLSEDFATNPQVLRLIADEMAAACRR